MEKQRCAVEKKLQEATRKHKHSILTRETYTTVMNEVCVECGQLCQAYIMVARAHKLNTGSTVSEYAVAHKPSACPTFEKGVVIW